MTMTVMWTRVAIALIAIVVAAALYAAVTRDRAPSFDDQVADYWASLNDAEQSTVCLALDDMTGFRLIVATDNGDGRLDLLQGGTVPDTHANRVAVGAALDRLAEREC